MPERPGMLKSVGSAPKSQTQLSNWTDYDLTLVIDRYSDNRWNKWFFTCIYLEYFRKDNQKRANNDCLLRGTLDNSVLGLGR